MRSFLQNPLFVNGGNADISIAIWQQLFSKNPQNSHLYPSFTLDLGLFYLEQQIGKPWDRNAAEEAERLQPLSRFF